MIQHIKGGLEILFKDNVAFIAQIQRGHIKENRTKTQFTKILLYT